MGHDENREELIAALAKLLGDAGPAIRAAEERCNARIDELAGLLGGVPVSTVNVQTTTGEPIEISEAAAPTQPSARRAKREAAER